MSLQHATEPPEHLQQPFDSFEAEILHGLWSRLHLENKHVMVALVGEEGDGKSLTAVRLASEIDPSFSADRVIFDVSELLRILNEGEHEPGQAYVLDEAGVSLGRRTWQDRSQVLANQALQLIRSHNLALFFTLPRLGELDSQAQGRLQAFFEIVEKKEGQWVKGKWKDLDPDRSDTTGTIYHKKPRLERNGQTVRVDYLRFAPMEGDVVEKYNDRKHEHQQEVYEETLEKLEESDNDQSEMSASDILADIEDWDQFVVEHNNGTQRSIDTDLIALEYDIGEGRSKRVKKGLLQRDEVPDDVL